MMTNLSTSPWETAHLLIAAAALRPYYTAGLPGHGAARRTPNSKRLLARQPV